MFERKSTTRLINSGKGFEYCSQCRTLHHNEPEKRFDGPYDFYGLPIGHELEWFEGIAEYCDNCGYANFNVGSFPTPRDFNTDIINLLKNIAKSDISQIEKRITAAIFTREADEFDLFLYYDFIGEKHKALELAKDLVKEAEKTAAECNEEDDASDAYDMILCAIEFNRRLGNFDKALELCDKYRKEKTDMLVMDEIINVKEYKHILKEEERMCKRGYKERGVSKRA